jgi:hypothetical protein
MATLDFQIKSGQIDKNIGLELLLLSIWPLWLFN